MIFNSCQLVSKFLNIIVFQEYSLCDLSFNRQRILNFRKKAAGRLEGPYHILWATAIGGAWTSRSGKETVIIPFSKAMLAAITKSTPLRGPGILHMQESIGAVVPVFIAYNNSINITSKGPSYCETQKNLRL